MNGLRQLKNPARTLIFRLTQLYGGVKHSPETSVRFRHDLEKDRYYRSGDYTGCDLGVEKAYACPARRKGPEILMKDASGRIKGKYENGIHDVAPTSGRNLKLSIDVDLQQYGEQLMQGKIGAIVAIEPATGEILALVTSPNYDPSLLVGKERGKNYSELVKNPYKPLYDRALQGMYPPGSTFKPTQGLIFLQEGIVTPGTAYPCYRDTSTVCVSDATDTALP